MPSSLSVGAQSLYESLGLSQYNSTSSKSNKLEEFVQKALSYNGYTASQWASSHPNRYHVNAWCADFVWACAEEVGIGGSAISGSAGAHMLISQTADNCGGVIHSGSDNYTPQRGDLVNFVWSGGTWADHIGIVTECDGSTVKTIEGNTSNAVHERSYNRSSSCLLRFCTPDWSKVGGWASSSGGVVGNLFQEKNTREDAIVREVAYFDNNYDACKDLTDIKLSIVNYTDLFTAFWDAGKSLLGSNADAEYDYSKLDSKVRTVVKYFVDKGLNNAAACGIAGNIKHESDFNTAAVGDGGTSFGLCQWHYDRGRAMKTMAGSNWATNLTGQLDYLWYELSNGYSQSVLVPLQNVDNSEAGARHAADVFVRKFEIPANVDYQSSIRQDSAAEYFNQITQIVKVSSSDNFSSVNYGNISDKRKKIIQAAESQLGTPYVWGGSTPGVGLDCSGLTQYCYAQAGISIAHYTETQYAEAPSRLSVNEATIGDILYVSGHVAIFTGDNGYIHEPSVGDVCKRATGISWFSHALHWNI